MEAAKNVMKFQIDAMLTTPQRLSTDPFPNRLMKHTYPLGLAIVETLTGYNAKWLPDQLQSNESDALKERTLNTSTFTSARTVGNAARCPRHVCDVMNGRPMT